ncbi:MAG TPA: hypothetical protein VGB73_13210 [Pyrinomonadaceae bacterium]|jgi:hypothetical protein
MLTKYIKPLFLSVIYLILCFNHSALAQTNEPSARKFDEFGDALPTDMAARLDNFAIELQNNPNVRAFLIVYRSHYDLPGLSSRRVNWMRNYLIYNRDFKADRIVAIDGGTASCLSHELWIVPPGTAPKPRKDAYSRGFEDTDVARKYDEYHYTILEDMLVSYSTEFENGLEGFAQALRNEPRTLAYIIAYEGYRAESWEEEDEKGRKKTHRRLSIDPCGTAWKELRSKKTELVKRYGLSPSRVKLVNGGYRKWREVEFWIVPR